MYCTACGAKNAAESNFCRQCGQQLDRTPPKISEEDFDRALPAEEQLSALLDRAYRLRKTGDLATAVALCEEALRLNPDSTSAHSLRGRPAAPTTPAVSVAGSAATDRTGVSPAPNPMPTEGNRAVTAANAGSPAGVAKRSGVPEHSGASAAQNAVPTVPPGAIPARV